MSTLMLPFFYHLFILIQLTMATQRNTTKYNTTQPQRNHNATQPSPCTIKGGWSELCCDFKFFTSFYNSQTPGDIALIVKKAPKTGAAVAQVSNNNLIYANNLSSDFSPFISLPIV